MAWLISKASGNLTGASTFATAEAGAGALALARNATTTNPFTTAVSSSTFTVTNAVVIEGVVLFIKNNTASPTGTLLVELQKSGLTQASVTVNKADLASTLNVNAAPVFFKFGSTATGDGAATWTLKLTGSVGSSSMLVQMNSATTTDWTRALRTTTAATAAAGDDLFIVGELTGAGTGNNITVTMDSTAATAYGSSVLNTTSIAGSGIHICKRGKLAYGTSAATNYILRLRGDLNVWDGGVYEMGSVATPMPRNSTAVLEFEQKTLDGDFGFVANDGSSVAMQGQSRSAGKDVVVCKLTVNAAASATLLTVDTDTGWLSGDQCAIASTSRTAAECETFTLNGNATVTQLTITNCAIATAGMAAPPTSGVALLAAHSGTDNGGGGDTRAEIILLTRNVKVRSTSQTLMSYVWLRALATADIDWVDFYYLGENLNGKRGVEIEAHTSVIAGAKNIQRCSIHDCEDSGFFVPSGYSANLVFRYNVAWNIAALNGSGINIGGSLTLSDWTISDCTVIRILTSSCFSLVDCGGTFQNNVAAGAATTGIGFTEPGAQLGNISDLVSHSNSTSGITSSGTIWDVTMHNFTAWRNNTSGIALGGTANVTVDGGTLFGNTQNIMLGSSMDVTFRNITAWSETTYAATGVATNAPATGRMVFIDCDFSGVGSGRIAHGTDINFSSGPVLSRITLQNTKLGSTFEVGNQYYFGDLAYVASAKHDQIAGAHKCWMRSGTTESDATIYKTIAPSLRMTPAATAMSFTGTRTISSPIITAITALNAGWVPQVGDRVLPSTAAAYTTVPLTITAVDLGNASITLSQNALSTLGGASFTLIKRLASAPADLGVKLALEMGATATLGVWVRKDAAYNGVQPRLIQRANAAIGIANDVVIDTAVGGTDAWEQLTGNLTAPSGDHGVVEMIVDCDGTAGYINVDDWTLA